MSRWRRTKRYERYGAEEHALYELVMMGSAPLARRALEAARMLHEGAPFVEPWRTIAREVAEALMRSGWSERAREVMEVAGARIPPDFLTIVDRLEREGPKDDLIAGQIATPATADALLAGVEAMAMAGGKSVIVGVTDDGREDRRGDLRKMIPDVATDDGWAF